MGGALAPWRAGHPATPAGGRVPLAVGLVVCVEQFADRHAKGCGDLTERRQTRLVKLTFDPAQCRGADSGREGELFLRQLPAQLLDPLPDRQGTRP